MMPSIHQRQKLQSQLVILLTSLDDKIEHSLWETLGEADNGLWNLFGFKKFDDYVDFMVDCGFIGRKHRVTKKPFFVEMVFAQACHSRFQQIRAGKKKLRYLEVGRRHQGKDAEQKRPVQQPDLKSWPLIHFWESFVIKKWLDSYYHSDCRTPGKQQLFSKRKDRPTPTPIKKKTLATPSSKISSRSPATLGYPQRSKRRFKSPTPAKKSGSSSVLSPTMSSLLKQRPTRLPLADLTKISKCRLPMDSPSPAFTKMQVDTSAKGAGSARRSSFLSPTTSSLQKQRKRPLLKDLTNISKFRLPIDAPSPTFTLKVDRASQTTTLNELQDLSDQNLAMQPPVELRVDSEPTLKIPRLLLLDEKPPTSKNKCPVENMMYREVAFHGEKLHFLVTKGWQVEIFEQRETKHMMAASFAFAIPSRMACSDKTQATKAEGKVENLKLRTKKLDKKIDTTRFTSSPFSRRLLAGLVAYQPKTSSLSWEQTIPIVLGAFLFDIGSDVSAEQLAAIAPTRQTMENLLFEFAVESAMLTRDAFEHSKVIYTAFDKADSSKGLHGGCVKLGATFDSRRKSEAFPDGEVIVCTLDADKTGDSSMEVGQSVVHSFNKLCLISAILWGITTDSGGGGTVESVARILVGLNLLVGNGHLIGNCCLHNLNLELAVPMKKWLMAPKTADTKDKKKDEVPRNVEQMLYTAFSWEHIAGFNVVKEYWDSSARYCESKVLLFDEFEEGDAEAGDKNHAFEDVTRMFGDLENGKSFVAMKRGAETRWWSIGEAADVLYQTLPMRRFMAMNFDDMKVTGKAKKICQDFISLSAEPVLLCDLALVKCFHRCYLAKHLKFFQDKDLLVRKAGFQAFSVFVRCFLMEEDIKLMITKWREMTEFADVQKRLKDVPAKDRAIQVKKIENFLRTAYAENKKMFNRWLKGCDLAFLAAFSEVETGKIVSRHLIGLPGLDRSEDQNVILKSPNHGRDIHLGRFATFVAESINESQVELRLHFHIKRNDHLIRQISDGFNLWDRNDPRTESARILVLESYGAFFSNTQGAERANKDQNLASLNQREEGNISLRLMASARIKEVCDATILGAKRKVFRGREKIKEMYRRICAVHSDIESLKTELGEERYDALNDRISENLRKTFQATRVQKEKEDFEAAFSVVHVPSAKENLKGFDISPLLEDKLQLGKIFNKGRNVELLLTEWAKRMENNLKRRLTDDEMKSIREMRVGQLKADIKKDEQARDGNNEKYNDKFFKVLYTPLDGYQFKIV
jgi:hypothetical protein